MRMRLLIIVAAVAAPWAVPADASASSFGLTYSRQCSSCGFCVRPYNAFSSVTCGVANVCPQGPCCSQGFGGLNPSCYGKGCGLKGKCGLFGGCEQPEYLGDDAPGAFGCCGPQVAFFGQPANMKGYNPGCTMPWMYDQAAVNVPGHTPPPGPYWPGSNASCCNVWLPPAPFPGMYGIPYPYHVHPYLYPPYQQGHKPQSHPVHGRNLGGTAPTAYQQPQAGQGGYSQPATWWYPGYGVPPQMVSPAGYYNWGW